jgi:hypothetical protein
VRVLNLSKAVVDLPNDPGRQLKDKRSSSYASKWKA